MKMNRLLLLVLGLSVTLNATEMTVRGVGSDQESAIEDGERKVYEKYHTQLVSQTEACKNLSTPVIADASDFEVFKLEVDGIVESDGKYEADILFDVEEKEGFIEQLETECIAQAQKEKEDRKAAQETEETLRAMSDFGSRFNIGLAAYGLYGYGVGGYLEYRHNDFFSVYLNGAYNNTEISQDAAIETEPDVYTKAQEVITAGVEVRLLLLLLGYEYVVDSATKENVIDVTKPTGAFTVGLVVPAGALMKQGNIRGTPRVEYGIYYKQFNDVIVVNGKEESDSFVGGLFVRLRVF